MIWSAVCSGSPHSHAALPASPHFFMDALHRPTPVRILFRVVQCFRLRSSPLTPFPGSDTCAAIDVAGMCTNAPVHRSKPLQSKVTQRWEVSDVYLIGRCQSVVNVQLTDGLVTKILSRLLRDNEFYR